MRNSASLVGLALAGMALAVPIAAQQAANPQRIDRAWLRSDPATRTVEFELIAGLTGLRGALNFNGYVDGGLTLTVPLGWSVVMHFSNHDGDLPHSAQVIADVRPVPTGPTDNAFPRAQTIRLSQGLQAGETDDLRFVADRTGSFLIFCAVPGHGGAGMWVRLVVSDQAAAPSISETPVGGS